MTLQKFLHRIQTFKSLRKRRLSTPSTSPERHSSTPSSTTPQSLSLERLITSNEVLPSPLTDNEPTADMPMIVPGINDGQAKAAQEDWSVKLLGKTLGDRHDETTFKKDDLPHPTRVIKPGDMATMDHNPNRMNVYLGDDGTVRKVDHQ